MRTLKSTLKFCMCPFFFNKKLKEERTLLKKMDTVRAFRSFCPSFPIYFPPMPPLFFVPKLTPSFLTTGIVGVFRVHVFSKPRAYFQRVQAHHSPRLCNRACIL